MKAKPVRQSRERRVAYTVQPKPRAPCALPFPQARYLTRKERAALKAYQDYLLAKLPDQIERIVLFGSKARGDSARDSDVDVLVAIKGAPIKGLGACDSRWQTIVDPTFDFLMEYGVYLSPTVMHIKKTKEWTPLLAHIRKDGIELWRCAKKSISN